MEQNRATCWSITINNPLESDYMVQKPPGWELVGQLERGEQGTLHYQGMLKTPQVRFSAVKKIFPKAHIEVAKNKLALEKYVTKSETRVATVDTSSVNIPSLFDYQHTIASKWDEDDWKSFQSDYTDEQLTKLGIGEIALLYVDKLVAEDIENGQLGVEYIAVNPMWRSAWKRFWRSMISREKKISTENINAVLSPQEAVSQEICQEE